jgi:hypothetical protein
VKGTEIVPSAATVVEASTVPPCRFKYTVAVSPAVKLEPVTVTELPGDWDDGDRVTLGSCGVTVTVWYAVQVGEPGILQKSEADM